MKRKKSPGLGVPSLSNWVFSNLQPLGRQLGLITEGILIESEGRSWKAQSRTQKTFMYLKKLDSFPWAWRPVQRCLGQTDTADDNFTALREVVMIQCKRTPLNTIQENPLRRAKSEEELHVCSGRRGHPLWARAWGHLEGLQELSPSLFSWFNK